MKPAARRVAMRLVVVLAAVAVSLSAAELALRLAPPAWLKARMRVVSAGRAHWGSDAGWPVDVENGVAIRFVPGSHFSVDHDEYVHDVHIDEYGGRTSARPSRADAPLVPVFGDSFVMGLGVADADTFVSRLADQLPVRLLNMGISGSSLPVHLNSIERLDDRLGRPSACVFGFFIGNDFTDILAFADAARPGRPASPSTGSRLVAVNRFIERHAPGGPYYLGEAIRAASLSVVNSWLRHPIGDAVFEVMSPTADLSEIRETLSVAVARLREVSARLHFRPIVVLIPDRNQVDAVLRKERAAWYGYDARSLDPSRPTRLIVDALAREGIEWIDGTSCFPSANGYYYVRDMHFTAAGHAAFAACIGPALREKLAAGAGTRQAMSAVH